MASDSEPFLENSPPAMHCEFCGKPVEDAYFRTFERSACAGCAKDAAIIARGNEFNSRQFAVAVIGGFAAMLVAAGMWATGRNFAASLIAGVAILIGIWVGKIVKICSGGRRGKGLQWLGGILGVGAIATGTECYFAWLLHEAAVTNGTAMTAKQFSHAFTRGILLRPTFVFTPIDGLWAGLAAFSAWRVCRPIPITITGPHAITVANVPATDATKLDQLAAEARWQEQFNPKMAVVLWEQCLELLPADSRRRDSIQQEIDRIVASPQPSVSLETPGAIPPIRTETFANGLWKTSLSMLVSILFYAAAWKWDWPVAIGFVLLILIHELGHVVANIFYGVPISAPIFIPFIGAIINLRQPPANAKIEAICAIAGPIAGTIGALGCFGWYFYDHSDLAMTLAWFGFTINLFNLLPVPPLDGGRVAAAISPWIWVVGLIGMGAMMVGEFRERRGPGILLLVLIFAIPRVIATLKPNGRSGPYYQIGRTAPVVIGAAYLLLLGALICLRIYSQHHLV